MNERIKELIKASGGIGHDDDGNELTPALVGRGLEKFAELIVKECIYIAKRADNTQPMEYSYIEIAKYFGIKGVEE